MAFRKPKGKRRLKILLFGTYGVGKTTAALQAPGAAVFDLEEGTNFYGDVGDFRVDDEKDPFRITESIENYAKNPVVTDEDGKIFKIKTVVIDPISNWETNLEQSTVARIRKEKRDPNYVLQPLDYKILTFEKKRLMTRVLTMDMNVFICARTKDIYAPGQFMKKIGIGPDCHDAWMGFCDTVLYLYFDAEHANKRMAIVYGKDRTGKLPIDKDGKPVPFEWNYKNLAKYMVDLNYDADSDATVSQSTMDTMEGRSFETIFQGAPIKTGGVTGETLETIVNFYKDETLKTKFKDLLATVAEVSEPYDLTEDMAKFLIDETLKKEQ